jgi:hypothetical protein
MSKAVVDTLELVDIQQDGRGLASASRRPGLLLFQSFHQVAAVVELRERVGDRFRP